MINKIAWRSMWVNLARCINFFTISFSIVQTYYKNITYAQVWYKTHMFLRSSPPPPTPSLFLSMFHEAVRYLSAEYLTPLTLNASLLSLPLSLSFSLPFTCQSSYRTSESSQSLSPFRSLFVPLLLILHRSLLALPSLIFSASSSHRSSFSAMPLIIRS